MVNIRISGSEVRSMTLEVLSKLGQRILLLYGSAEVLQDEIGSRTTRLAPGTYLLRLRRADFSQVQRVVKQ